MNYFDIQNNFLTISTTNCEIKEIICTLNEYILNQDCEQLKIDISALNIIDAMKLGVMCSTSHFTKYPFGSVEWIVKDIETKNLLKKLSLKTVKFTIKETRIKDFLTQVFTN